MLACACRYDQGATPALQSDMEELRTALQPADAAALRKRGDARFAAGDAAGAADAFTALLSLPEAAVSCEENGWATASTHKRCAAFLRLYS